MMNPDLDAARGIVYGTIAGFVCWGIILLLYYVLTL
jgi:hypothetical protein